MGEVEGEGEAVDQVGNDEPSSPFDEAEIDDSKSKEDFDDDDAADPGVGWCLAGRLTAPTTWSNALAGQRCNSFGLVAICVRAGAAGAVFDPAVEMVGSTAGLAGGGEFVVDVIVAVAATWTAQPALSQRDFQRSQRARPRSLAARDRAAP